mgnify:CR=1 FL=1|tara:strand:+ start:2530 stop:3411 length:882 start_codon:yes stop_codon:yes gene_type:complete
MKSIERVSNLREPQDGRQPFGLLEFANKLMQEMKGFSTSVCNHSNRLWVYRKGDNYAVGMIGYGDFQSTGDGEDRYAVWSPNIKNMKYNGGEQQSMCLALKRGKAIKNALQYLRPLSIKQTVKLSLRDCGNAAGEVVSKARDSVGEIRREMTNNLFDTSTYSAPKPNALQRELKHMVESGYEFLDKDLGDKIAKIVGGVKELAMARDANKNTFTFVEASVSPTGRQVFRVLNDVDANSAFSFDPQPDEMSVYDQHNLPDELAGKMSVLSMLEAGGYVEGVGYKVSDTIFYLRG